MGTIVRDPIGHLTSEGSPYFYGDCVYTVEGKARFGVCERGTSVLGAPRDGDEAP